MLRKLLSHAAIYGLAAQLPRLAGVLALPLITQYLTPADYGVAGVVSAYFYAFALLQSLGLSVVMANTYVKYPVRYRWIWRQLYGFLTIWSWLYGLLVFGVLYFVVPPEATHDRWMIAALNTLPIMFLMSTDLIAGMYFQLSQRLTPLAIRSFLLGSINVALSIYLIAYLRMGYMGWFYAAFVASVISSVYYLFQIGQHKLWPIFNFKRQRIQDSLRISLPVIPHHLSFFMLDTSDRLVLDMVGVTIRRIGLYNVASNFGAYFMAASGAIVQAATPFYMNLYAQDKSRQAALQVRQLTYSLQLLFFAATFLGSLWMKEIFEILIRNAELQQAYPLAIVILMGYNFRPMYMAANNLLSFHEHTSKLWRISAIAGIGNIILNFILVPLYGFEMAAYTTFAALMYTGYAGYFLKEYKQAAEVNYYPMLWLLATLVLSGLVYSMSGMGVEGKVGVTLVVVAIGLAAMVKYKKLLS
jgi:O-antigen/teichoic acid export membrane protein